MLQLIRIVKRRRPSAPGTASSTQPAYPTHPEVSTPTGPAGGDLEGSEYPAPVVAPEKIGSGKLTAAVRALLLGPGAVITEYLAAGAVTVSALSAAVQAKLLGVENVATANLGGEAVTESKLAIAVRNLLLGPNRVITEDLSAGAVTEPKLGEESVSLGKLIKAVVERLRSGAFEKPAVRKAIESGVAQEPSAARDVFAYIAIRFKAEAITAEVTVELDGTAVQIFKVKGPSTEQADLPITLRIPKGKSYKITIGGATAEAIEASYQNA